MNPIIRTQTDDRLLADPVLRTKINDSLPIASVDIDAYDIVYLAGGWGAAFDLGFSEPLAAKITGANASGSIIGAGLPRSARLINATASDGKPLVEGRHVTVSNRQCATSGSPTHRSIPRPSSAARARCTSPANGSPTCSRTIG